MEELVTWVSSACGAMCLAMLSSLLSPTILGLFSLEEGKIMDWAAKLRVWVKGCLKALSGASRFVLIGLVKWKGKFGGFGASEFGENMTEDAINLFLLGS